ncbi:MAG: GEVED domain-containing protein, partial [Candidatus Sericytochromatia bacterium]
KSGFNGVPSDTFNQFAELNADEVSALYQDVITTPGATVNIRVAHRGRSGTDVAAVKIGDPNGTLSSIGTMTDGTTAWGEYSYTYVVPVGQNVTRIQFEAVSAAGGATLGNFIDSVVAFSTVPCPMPRDYGDAPDSFKTLSASTGAYLKNPMNPLKLGTNNGDSETDGFPNATADGDDVTSTDDEDGVSSFNAITNNLTSYSVTVTATNLMGVSAHIRGWIDFDGSGVFEDDEASNNQTVTGALTNVSRTLTWTVPSDVTVGTKYVRIRISTDALAVTDDIGVKTNGEVEDYTLAITQATDFGDAPDSYGTVSSSTAAKHNIVSNLKMGASTLDHESVGPSSGDGTQDDTTGTDDEDGVSSFNTLVSNDSSYSVIVNTNNTTGSPANLRGWIDFDRNGIFEDDEASVLSTTNVPDGTNGNVTLTWSTIPSDTSAGSSYIRLRLTTDALAVTDDIGAKTNGEVEDYTLAITQATDFGDAPDTYGTVNASTAAKHNIVSTLKMGTNVPDHESVGPSSGTGTQDDSTGTDDEDGVTSFNLLSNNLTTYSVVVNANNSTGSAANLRGWIDFDRNGTFDDNEVSDLSTTNVPNGTSGNITLTWSSIPNTISVGNTYIRLRLTTQSLAVTDDIGVKLNGEVEDYPLTIIQGVDYGDAPNSYSTTTTSHNISNNLKMGTNAGDHDVTPPSSGTGIQDDTTDIDDEDGVSLFNVLNTSDTSYSVTVNV